MCVCVVSLSERLRTRSLSLSDWLSAVCVCLSTKCCFFPSVCYSQQSARHDLSWDRGVKVFIDKDRDTHTLSWLIRKREMEMEVEEDKKKTCSSSSSSSSSVLFEEIFDDQKCTLVGIDMLIASFVVAVSICLWIKLSCACYCFPFLFFFVLFCACVYLIKFSIIENSLLLLLLPLPPLLLPTSIDAALVAATIILDKFRKRVPLRPHARKTDIYVTRSRKYQVIYKRATQLLIRDGWAFVCV